MNRKGYTMIEMLGAIALIVVVIIIMYSMLSDAGDNIKQPVKETCSLSGAIGMEGFCANPAEVDVAELNKDPAALGHEGQILRHFGKLGCSQEENEQNCFIWVDDPEYEEEESEISPT